MKFWLTLATWYGITAGQPAADSKSYGIITMPYDVPPRGFGGPGVIHPTLSFLKWSEKPEIPQAWEDLKKQCGVQGGPFGTKALETFGLIDGELLGGWGQLLSMNKSRKLGRHGFVDTT